MSEPACWATLPTELQHQVFREVEDDPEATAATFLNYVLVNKQWQQWFEFCTYENLTINSSRLSDLDRLVGQNEQRQSAVKKITLRVHLKPQPQDKNERSDDYQLRLSRRGPILTAALVGLLQCLKSWNRKPHQRGLALEIITYFPKQSTSRITQNHADGTALAVIPSPKINLDQLENPLPQVPVVTSLILREKYLECLKYPTLATLIKTSLTNLKRLHIEGDHVRVPSFDDRSDNDITEVVQAFPTTLRSWTFIDPFPLYASGWPVNGEKMPFRHIASNLESLVFTHTVDASDFFLSCLKPFGPGCSPLTWPKLRFLSLNSRQIHDRNGDDELRKRTLLEAARVVKRMPNIDVFEIWRVLNRDGAVFKYTTTTINPTKSTGTIKKAAIRLYLGENSGGHNAAKELWDGDVQYAWEDVADMHGRSLSVTWKPLVFWDTRPLTKPTHTLLYYEQELIDWDGSEAKELAEKGEDALVESI